MHLRETASRASIVLLWLHVPIAIAIGLSLGDGLAAARPC